MKIFLTLLVLLTSLYSLNINESYENFSDELDRLAPSLTTETKTTLYYLSLATQQKLLSQEPIEHIKEKVLSSISKLHEDDNELTAFQIEELRALYLDIFSAEMPQQKQHQNSTSLILLITIALIFLMIGFAISYFIFAKKESKKRKK